MSLPSQSRYNRFSHDLKINAFHGGMDGKRRTSRVGAEGMNPLVYSLPISSLPGLLSRLHEFGGARGETQSSFSATPGPRSQIENRRKGSTTAHRSSAVFGDSAWIQTFELDPGRISALATE